MRGLMRLLMMFGPMIFQQYQKYQRNKQRNQGGLATPDTPRHRNTHHRDVNAEVNQSRPVRRNRAQTPPPPPPAPTEMDLKEEDIMLTDKDLRHTSANNVNTHNSDQPATNNTDDMNEMLEDLKNEAPKKNQKDNDLDLTDLFLD